MIRQNCIDFSLKKMEDVFWNTIITAMPLRAVQVVSHR